MIRTSKRKLGKRVEKRTYEQMWWKRREGLRLSQSRTERSHSFYSAGRERLLYCSLARENNPKQICATCTYVKTCAVPTTHVMMLRDPGTLPNGPCPNGFSRIGTIVSVPCMCTNVNLKALNKNMFQNCFARLTLGNKLSTQWIKKEYFYLLP